MSLPEIEVERVRRWCATQTPPEMREQMRVECDVADRHLTIVDVRPPWDGVGEHTRAPVARLKYVASRGEWSLLWCDSNDRFHAYDEVPASRTTEPLLDELDRDPTCIFWG